MSNTINSAVPITFVPFSAVSSPESLYQSLTLTLPQEPVTAPISTTLAPVLIPSPHIQTNPVNEYTTHTEDYLCRIRTFHVPTYALDGVQESLQ